MRGPIHATMAGALVAACAAPEPPLSGAGAHEAMVATLGSDFVWDCTLTADTAAAPWRFVLQRQDGRRRNVLLLQAGRAPSRPLEVAEDGAARIYGLPDETELIIASDGEAFASGPGGAMGKTHTAGRCEKGGQPA